MTVLAQQEQDQKMYAEQSWGREVGSYEEKKKKNMNLLDSNVHINMHIYIHDT